MRVPISLDKREKNSNGQQFREVCPRTRKYIEFTDGQILKTMPLECKKYDCHVCGPRKIKADREKYYNMSKCYLDAMKSKYPKDWKRDGEYWVKMVTLTCPGRVTGCRVIKIRQTDPLTLDLFAQAKHIKKCSKTIIA